MRKDSKGQILYHNHLKGEYALTKSDHALIITATSCYRMNAETVALIRLLPKIGSRDFYLETMQAMGLERGTELFERLVIIGALVARQKRSPLRKIFLALIMPDIKLISSHWQEKLFGALGVNWQAQQAWLAKRQTTILGITALILMTAALLAFPPGHRQITQTFSLFLIVLLGGFVHELGHSIAAATVGIGLRPIGFSIYLLFPVFYTNVSGIEKLTLKEKIWVDCGGFVAQSLFLLVCLSLGIATQNAMFFESACWITYIMVFNLNPLLKTDGYWLYRDIRSSLQGNRWPDILHALYIAAFFAFTLYLFRYLFVHIEKISNLLIAVAHNPITLVQNGHKIILGVYLLIMIFVGGSRRLKEVGQEWRSFKRETILVSNSKGSIIKSANLADPNGVGDWQAKK